jgi:hypothetical protein
MRFKAQNETCKTTPSWEGQRHEIPASDHDELLSLMGDVLDALEAQAEQEHPGLSDKALLAGDSEFAKASRDPARKDAASISERKAWLAIYGPMTDVLTD